MEIPAWCTSRFQFDSRLPEFFGDEMNDPIFREDFLLARVGVSEMTEWSDDSMPSSSSRRRWRYLSNWGP